MRFHNVIPMHLLIAFFLLTVFAFPALATDYYVSPDGTASWPNCTSEDNPCPASSTETDFLNASAGDTVIFLDGTYDAGTQPSAYRDIVWNPSNSGTSDNKITFKAKNSKQAIIDGTVSPDASEGIRVNVIGARLRDHIVWEGFKVTANGGDYLATVRFDGTDGATSYCSAKDCEVVGASHNKGGWGNYEGIRVENADNITIENCYVHGFIDTENSHNTSGYKSYNTNYVTIKNCEFANNIAGIYIKGYANDNYTIENTWIHGSDEGLRVSSKNYPTDNLTVKNCVFSNQDGYNWSVGPGWDGESTTNNLVIHNNTFIGDYGPVWLLSDVGKEAVVYNNIIYDRSSYYDLSGKHDEDASEAVSLGGTYTIKPKECDHNRLSDPPSIRIGWYAVKDNTYTTLSGWQSSGELADGSNPGTGSITDDPQFVNSSGTLSELTDFALADGSPCKGAGRDGTDMGADVSNVGIRILAPTSLQISTK